MKEKREKTKSKILKTQQSPCGFFTARAYFLETRLSFGLCLVFIVA